MSCSVPTEGLDNIIIGLHLHYTQAYSSSEFCSNFLLYDMHLPSDVRSAGYGPVNDLRRQGSAKRVRECHSSRQWQVTCNFTVTCIQPTYTYLYACSANQSAYRCFSTSLLHGAACCSFLRLHAEGPSSLAKGPKLSDPLLRLPLHRYELTKLKWAEYVILASIERRYRT